MSFAIVKCTPITLHASAAPVAEGYLWERFYYLCHDVFCKRNQTLLPPDPEPEERARFGAATQSDGVHLRQHSASEPESESEAKGRGQSPGRSSSALKDVWFELYLPFCSLHHVALAYPLDVWRTHCSTSYAGCLKCVEVLCFYFAIA